MLVEFFTAALQAKGILTEQPILGVSMKPGAAFCFIELRAVADVAPAMVVLQGTTLGVNLLKISRPSDWQDPPPHLVNFVVPSLLSSSGDASIATLSGLSTLPSPATLPEGTSKIVQLFNILEPGEVQDETELKDILLDLEYECHQHGQVEKLVFVQKENPPKVLVEFASRHEAHKACEALRKRAFLSRRVNPVYFDETQYSQGVY